MTYQCPLGKSCHIVTEVETKEVEVRNTGEAFMEEGYNYGKTNFDTLREYYANSDWSIMNTAKNVHNKCGIFMEKYKEAITRHVAKD